MEPKQGKHQGAHAKECEYEEAGGEIPVEFFRGCEYFPAMTAFECAVFDLFRAESAVRTFHHGYYKLNP